MLKRDKEMVEVGVGTNGGSVNVPMIVTRSGRTPFDIAVYVEKNNFSGEAGRAVAIDAIKQVLVARGYTHPIELVTRRFDEAMATDVKDKWAGVSVQLYGLNCGYPVAMLESATRSAEPLALFT